MTDCIPTYITIPLLTALSVAQPAVQLPCEGWTTEEFWKTTDAARVTECIAHGHSVHDRLPPRNLTVLHLAARFSADPEVIAVLVDAGADLEASSAPDHRTPLHVAARSSATPEIVRTLLRYGADPYAVNHFGRTPLHLAALFSENPAIVEELVRATDVNVRAGKGATPLHDAARRRSNAFPQAGEPNQGIVEVLLRHGADLSAQGLDGVTPVRTAETRAAADLIQSETQRRAATRERFLQLIGTRVSVGAIVLTLLGSLVVIWANGPGGISWPSTGPTNELMKKARSG